MKKGKRYAFIYRNVFFQDLNRDKDFKKRCGTVRYGQAAKFGLPTEFAVSHWLKIEL